MTDNQRGTISLWTTVAIAAMALVVYVVVLMMR